MLSLLKRAVIALEKIAGTPHITIEPALFKRYRAFIWLGDAHQLHPIKQTDHVTIDLLQGVDAQKDTLYRNSAQLQQGHHANNCLLWGARGTGKSALIKAVHATLNAQNPTTPLYLIEIAKTDLSDLPALLRALRDSDYKIIIFCDDLSFEDDRDEHYKALKTILEGGIQGCAKNIVFYATSNRRHLIKRHMSENKERYEIAEHESTEEKVSLSDRFGLWLGFYPITQDTYFAIIEAYLRHYNIDIAKEVWRPRAIEWCMTRGNRSGRVAWQFIQDLAASTHHHL